jgi:tetratricopeptide (TPR) repeat protein
MMELLAEESGKEGDACMKNDKFIEAMIHYTKAIKLDPYNPNLYIHRSTSFLKIQQYYYALQDAKDVIRLLPKSTKGYALKGNIYSTAELYEEAVAAYQEGLRMTGSSDPALLKSLAEAKQKWKSQRVVENRMPWYGIGLGLVVGLLFICADEAVATKKLMPSDIVRSVALTTLIVICYGFARLYRYFLQTQRKSLVELPLDLSGEGETKAEEILSSAVNGSKKDESSPNRTSSQQRKKKSH